MIFTEGVPLLWVLSLMPKHPQASLLVFLAFFLLPFTLSDQSIHHKALPFLLIGQVGFVGEPIILVRSRG